MPHTGGGYGGEGCAVSGGGIVPIAPRIRVIATLRIAVAAMVLMLPVALSGCVGARPLRTDVADHAQMVYVERPVPVACVQAGSLPMAPAPVGAALNGEARHDAAILASALLAERAARDRAMALLAGCGQ